MRRYIALLLLTLTSVALIAPPANASERRSDARISLGAARGILEGAEALLGGGRSTTSGPHDATPILRELVRAVPTLTGQDRARAMRILARPTDGILDPFDDGYTVPSEVTCTTHFCVHWVESTGDAPPLDDADADGLPDRVETAAEVLEHVWTVEIDQMGYRAPKSDATSPNHGPDAKLDVYLADIAPVFGYVATDDPNASSDSRFWDVSAYMVLDNDHSAAEFPSTNGLDALRVTVAHEFFHTVQYAYDWFEDLWLMEGTATWMEEQVYDDVDDAVNYLRISALTDPDVPLDLSNPRFGYLYGNWIFFEFLAEYLGTGQQQDPTIVRRIWELADGAPGGPDHYSIAAVAQALRQRDRSFRSTFADFGVWNAIVERTYDEGGAYPEPRPVETFVLTGRRSVAGPSQVRLDHLTNAYLVFRPGRGVRSDAELEITVDLPGYPTGPEATALIESAGGRVRVRVFRLDRSGDANVTVPFGRGAIAQVTLVLTNASTRYDCWRRTWFACQGRPRDDGMPYGYAAGVAETR